MIVTQLPPPTNLFEWMDTISKLIEIWFQAMGTLHPELGQLLRSLIFGWFAFVCFGLTLILLLMGQFIANPYRGRRFIMANLFKYKKITTNQKMLFSIAIGTYFGMGLELILAFFKPISIQEGVWCVLGSILLFWLLNPLLKRPESSQKLEDNIYDICEQYKQLTDNQIHENF
jgi:hypothetical protein